MARLSKQLDYQAPNAETVYLGICKGILAGSYTDGTLEDDFENVFSD